MNSSALDFHQLRLFASGSFPSDESVGKQKPEGASANNSISNHGNAFDRDEHPVIGNGGDAQFMFFFAYRALVQDQRWKEREQTLRINLYHTSCWLSCEADQDQLESQGH